MSGLPYFCEGEVVKGFGRGSKELGVPTANFPQEVVDKLPECVESGVYYGWANVDGGEVYKMVMSIGWNPYYNNTKKSMVDELITAIENDIQQSKDKLELPENQTFKSNNFFKDTDSKKD
ncbi:hypothetical protein FSP39_012503 [Pinctada imbricata]|uniref:riboflavin kinase n=1 Tax=Pinctada imbricata TaxID=66713 RepID=A0AA88Y074_PINIB|nr:hypothetical protein FSP39_012503 [Pinctada imbricata]